MKKRKVFLILLALVLVISTVAVGCTEPVEPEYIILGAPLPLLYNEGQSALRNLKLAVDEINDAGGFNVGGVNYKFKLEAMDTNDLNLAVPTSDVLAVVDDLITQKDADFIIGGPLRSDSALATMDLVSQYKTVTIWSAGFLSTDMGSKFAGDYDTYKYCFRTQGHWPQSDWLLDYWHYKMEEIWRKYGWAMEAAFDMWLMQQEFHEVDIIDPRPPFEEAGWSILGYDIIPTGTTDFSTMLDRAEASGAEILLLWFDMPESVYLIKEWYDRKIDMLPVGFVVPAHDSKAWEVFGGKCEYLVNIYPRAGITGINSQAIHYINLYESEFGIEPGGTWVAPVCYQAVYILKDALERAGSLDADAVIAALEATDMVGVYGKIAFDDNHDIICSDDPATGAISTWVQWINGERETVCPEVVKTADMVLPPWMD